MELEDTQMLHDVETNDRLLDLATIEAAYRQLTPRSADRFARASRHLPGGVAKGASYLPPYPIYMDHGEGCYLVDVDGRRYLDFANHHTAMVLGHGHPAVAHAVQDQIARGFALGAPVETEALLAEEISRRIPSVEMMRFTNSGTEATLHAVRLARGFTGRPKIAKMEGGYHGSHDSVEISVAPPLDLAGPPDSPRSVPQVKGISPGALGDTIVLPYNNIAACEQILARHRGELAAIVFDPRAGLLPLRAEFVQQLAHLAHQHGALFIFDEVVGFVTGYHGAQGRVGVTPDLTAFGKIVGGGFPVGCFGGRADLMRLHEPGAGRGYFQSGTFSGHPVSLTAGLATLQQLTPEAYARIEDLANHVRAGLNDLFRRRGFVAQAIGLGAIWSVYLTRNELVDYRSLARIGKTDLARAIFLGLLVEGIYLSHGLTFNLCSAAMGEAETATLLAAFEKVLG
jgi:glutamate-1-semialdehyde 2,1-aminomutase